MTIDEIRERKRQLEARIDELVTDFAADTGVFVFGLSITWYYDDDASGEVVEPAYVVTAEVRL